MNRPLQTRQAATSAKNRRPRSHPEPHNTTMGPMRHNSGKEPDRAKILHSTPIRHNLSPQQARHQIAISTTSNWDPNGTSYWDPFPVNTQAEQTTDEDCEDDYTDNPPDIPNIITPTLPFPNIAIPSQRHPRTEKYPVTSQTRPNRNRKPPVRFNDYVVNYD